MIMGVTMFLQQKLNPAPPDPIQAQMFMALPIIFTFMLAPFPAGLVIYWAWNNMLVDRAAMGDHAAHEGAAREVTGDAAPRPIRRADRSGGPRAAVRAANAASSPAPRRRGAAARAACPRSPSPAAPTSASRAWSTR